MNCATRFLSASKRYTWTSAQDMPFMPLEIEEDPDLYPNEPREPRVMPVAQSLPLRNICPICGSASIRPVAVPLTPSRLFEISISYRCGRCNGAFTRVSLSRITIRALLFVFVIGGILYVGTSKIRTRRPDTAPHINQNQIPKAPPPVLR